MLAFWTIVSTTTCAAASGSNNLAAIPGWLGWTEWAASSATGTERRSRGPGRLRFMAMLGLLLTGLFLLLILAQAIPTFFFDPCLE